MQAQEGLHHRRVQTRIEGEALPLPIHRVAEAPQLAHDRAAALGLPGPGALEEGIAAQVLLAGTLRLDLLLEDRLHGDRGVVGARQTEHIFALQALKAHDRVDQGGVESVAHVKAAGHVRRRDHHAERFAGGRRIGVEGARLLPGGLPAGLGAGRVVGLGQVGLGHGGGACSGPIVSKGLAEDQSEPRSERMAPDPGHRVLEKVDGHILSRSGVVMSEGVVKVVDEA